MEADERQWHLDRLEYFSASLCGDLFSKSGKVILGVKNYLYQIQRRRTTGEPKPQVYAKQMELGTANEPYAHEWLRVNRSETCVLLSKVFKKVEWAKFGASVDVLDEDKSEIVEIKTVTGEGELSWYFSPTVPFDRKRLRAFDDHRMQLAGQLLAYPEIEKISLLKYDPQLDNEFDMRDVTDPSRGLMFEFTRKDFGTLLSDLQKKIIWADWVLDSGIDIDGLTDFSMPANVLEEKSHLLINA